MNTDQNKETAAAVGFQGDDLAVTDKALKPTFPPTEDDVEASLSEDEDDEDPSRDDVEHVQEEELRSGLQSDDEEWGQELTGERPDNGYLPGQRIAEHGIDRENFPTQP